MVFVFSGSPALAFDIVQYQILWANSGPPRQGLIAYYRTSGESISLPVSDYDNIGETWQPIMFTDPATPIVFSAFADLWAAISVVEEFNLGNVMGTETKGIAFYDISAERTVLNRGLRYFGLDPIDDNLLWPSETDVWPAATDPWYGG